MESRIYKKLARRLIECEERSRLLKRMLEHEVGFREEEQFLIHEAKKLKGENNNFWT